MSDTLVTLNLEQWTNAVSALVNNSLNVGTEKTLPNASAILPKNNVNSKLLPKLQPAPQGSLSTQNLPGIYTCKLHQNRDRIWQQPHKLQV